MPYVAERDKIKKREWKRRNMDKHVKHNRKSLYKTRYGMTVDEVKEFKRVRNNRCDICNNERKKMCVDHKHGTKLVRGLLCHECNTMLGLAHDDIKVLTNAITYLEVCHS